MAFEQRAAVAENFEDLILCHPWDFKSKVQSSKSKVLQPRNGDAEFKKFFLCVSASLRLKFARAELD